MNHGTRAKYVHDECRCRRCKKANRDYARQTRAKKNGKAKRGTA